MQNRYNPFMQIHKGLRAMLYDTAIALQQNDFSQLRPTSLVVDQVQKVLWLIEGHAETEDTKVFPLIKVHAPEMVAEFEAQHEKDHQLCASVEACLESLVNCTDTESRMALGLLLQQAFQLFVAFNLEHMVMEETKVAPVIWAHYSDEDLHQLTASIVRSLPADKNDHYTDWMLIGNSDVEVIQWLSSVRATAPDYVYNGLCERARRVLNAERWKQIDHHLQATEAALN
jgi:hemerythrin-like domain-containing protein